MNRYFLRVEWKNRETTMMNDLSWPGVVEYLHGIYETAMNEQVYLIKIYPMIAREVLKEETEV